MTNMTQRKWRIYKTNYTKRAKNSSENPSSITPEQCLLNLTGLGFYSTNSIVLPQPIGFQQGPTTKAYMYGFHLRASIFLDFACYFMVVKTSKRFTCKNKTRRHAYLYDDKCGIYTFYYLTYSRKVPSMALMRHFPIDWMKLARWTSSRSSTHGEPSNLLVASGTFKWYATSHLWSPFMNHGWQRYSIWQKIFATSRHNNHGVQLTCFTIMLPLTIFPCGRMNSFVWPTRFSVNQRLSTLHTWGAIARGTPSSCKIHSFPIDCLMRCPTTPHDAQSHHSLIQDAALKMVSSIESINQASTFVALNAP